MQISEAIKTLTEYYKPDEHIIMAHWDKEGWSDENLTDEQWQEVVRRMEHLTENILEDIYWKITETIKEVKDNS